MGDSLGHGSREVSVDTDAEQEPPFQPLTSEEAQAWRARNPMVSPWRVVAAQAALGAVCVLLAWVLPHRHNAVWSALYGAAVVVVPGALMAFGMTRKAKRGARSPAALFAGFALWEMIKIAVSVAMLVVAVKVVPDLSWAAMLLTLVVCMKLGWLAMLWRRQPTVTKTQTKRV
jgi:ATP synthase protein I